ncbi:MAG TPA: hypothetical protein VGI81_19210 [Tepidisphaeraceae bacterium]|jgi:hypothetical protein
MKDLYKRLNVPEGATEEQIRQRLPAASVDLRAASEMILLEPRRRRVYDRNRQLLVAIAQLRTELGLTYTRFWSRREFKDFWPKPAVVFSATPIPVAEEKPKRRVDKVMIAQAFHAARTVHHHSRHHVARWGWAWAAAAITVTLVTTILVLWHLSY